MVETAFGYDGADLGGWRIHRGLCDVCDDGGAHPQPAKRAKARSPWRKPWVTNTDNDSSSPSGAEDLLLT